MKPAPVLSSEDIDPEASPPAERLGVPGEGTITSQVMTLARRIQGDYLQRIKGTGLTPSQARVLRELAFSPGIVQHELATRLEIGNVSIGEALTKLERAGLVARERRSDNRRAVCVNLTPSGEEVLGVLASEARKQMAQIEAMVGSGNARRLTELLELVNTKFRSERSVAKVE